MAEVKLVTADAIRVPARAGEVVINRLVWPVTKQTNGDTVLIGYLPANCVLVPGQCQVIADGATAATTFDVCVDGATNKVAAAVAVTAATFKQADFTTHDLAVTLGKSDKNRPVTLTLTTAPTAAGGKIIVDIACFAP